jgi:hypothetical protein
VLCSFERAGGGVGVMLELARTCGDSFVVMAVRVLGALLGFCKISEAVPRVGT